MRALLTSILFFNLFVLVAQAPGGVTANLAGWYEANSGTSIAAGKILGWNDISGNTRHASQTNAALRPTLNSSTGFNYNVSIAFDGQTTYLNIPDLMAATTTGLSAFAVARQTATNRDIYGCILVGQTNNIGASGGYGITSQVTSNNAFGVFVRDFGVNYVSQATTLSSPTIMSGIWNGVTPNAVQYFSNGSSQGTDPYTPGSVGDNGNSYIGSGVGSGSDYCFYGDIAEIAVYNVGLNATNVSKIESYLSLKHGITKSGNYLSSDGSTIFVPAVPYINNIIGIGKDIATNLNQKQSKNYDDSARVFVSSLATFNNSNTGVIPDKQFIVLGANSGRLSNAAVEKPAGIFSRIEREWKVTNTNFSPNFNFSIKLNAKAAPGSVTTSQLRLLVDDDGDFSNATVYTSADGLTFSYSNPLITVENISTSMIPGGATRFITIGSANASTPLPIELLNFKAIACNKEVCLSWQTASEKDNDHFEVQRSADGGNWETLASVKGAGNSSIKLSYSEIDPAPLRGVSYYRLKQVDISSLGAYSQVVSVNMTDKEVTTLIYPNPCDLFVEIEDPPSYTISLFNTLGDNFSNAVKLSLNANGSLRLTTSDLPQGIYYLQFKGLPEQSRTFKLLVRH